MDSKGRYWVGAGDLPLVFGPDGRFQSSPARKGSGPGELPSYGVPLASLPGDSVVVDGGDRILVFDGMLRAARTIVAPIGLRHIAAAHWPRLVFASASVPSRQLVGFPIHTIDFSKPAIQVLRSGSPTGERLNPFGEDIYEKVAAKNDELWSVATSSYRLVRWDSDLKRTTTFLRRPAWWRQPSKNLLGNKTTAPQPYVTAVHFDESGLLWVFIHVPTVSWRKAWDRVPSNASEIREGMLNPLELHTTLVEVIDVAAGRLIAKKDIGRYTISAMPGHRIAVVGETPEGAPWLEIVALSPNGRR